MIITVEDAIKIYGKACDLCRGTIKTVEEKYVAAQLERENGEDGSDSAISIGLQIT